MENWKTVQDSREEMPEELDTKTSRVLVYKRKNIRREQLENPDGSQSTVWAYEQMTYTREQWDELTSPAQQQRMQALSDIQADIAMLGI